MKVLLWRLQAAAVFIVSLLLSVLPCKTGKIIGLLLYYVWGSRRKIAIDNLKKSSIFPHLSRTPELIIKDSFRNLGLSFMEVIKIYHGRGGAIIEGITINGIKNFEDASSRGKGVIILTGHCGNWELMAIASSSRMARGSGVARPLKNPYLNKFLEETRSRFGNSVIYKKGALKKILSALKNGGNVGILMDQAVLPDEGYLIDFLGQKAWTTKMPALVARKTGASVLPVFMRRTDKGHDIDIYPEIELSSAAGQEDALMEDTKKFSHYIEEYIRQNPSEWLWLHRRWKRAPAQDGIMIDNISYRD